MVRAVVLFLLAFSLALGPLAGWAVDSHEAMAAAHAMAENDSGHCDGTAAPSGLDAAQGCLSCPCASALPALPHPSLRQSAKAADGDRLITPETALAGLNIPPPAKPPRA